MTDIGPNAARARGGAAGRKHEEISDSSKNKCRIQSWQDVDHRTEYLTAVADYRDQLLVRLGWAGLKLELGMHVDELDDLLAAAEDLKLVCAALGGRAS
jgi:hypothetical protein